ncbi:MAG: heme lyase CcmF/NrfE family subunit [Micromonosporaceae bacterium]|nr:heme lyase CcmF/NrfE family subunit [Micromonosporaceae bacterium]
MIGPAGRMALALSLVTAVTATLLWARVALLRGSIGLARTATWICLVSTGAAGVLLDLALVTLDFRLRYVADNGGRDVPLYFRVTSLWAALDGSLLLWLVIVAACSAVVASARRRSTVWPWAMTVLSGVTVFFCAVAYFAANPFDPVAVPPADGPGPNPLLREHPAMGLHPPILYSGYVGLVVPFAYAVSALIAGRADRAAALALRRWTLVAWTLLTLGITLGAWWSYAVLGWGGYWAWDPVENASLLPWLTATATLHTLLVRRPGHPLWTWPIVLAAGSFLLVLLGTFLTRSGIVTSVHAFTASPLGPLLLGFFLLATALVGALMLWRLPHFGDGRRSGLGIVSRAMALHAQAVLMVVVAVVVVTGTLVPVLLRATRSAEVTVGPAYFNRAAVPVVLMAVLLMGVAPFLRSGRPLRQFIPSAIAALLTIGAVGLLAPPSSVLALVTFGAAAFVLAGLARAAFASPRPVRLGALVAHAGVALLAVGVAASSAFAATTERRLGVGESTDIDGVTIQVLAIDRKQDATGMRVAVRTAVTDHAGPAVISEPNLRYYPGHDLTVSIPAIRVGLTRDIYTTVLAVAEDGTSATVRLTVNPLVGLVWVGGFLVALGGALSLYRRRRVPAPAPEPVLVNPP